MSTTSVPAPRRRYDNSRRLADAEARQQRIIEAARRVSPQCFVVKASVFSATTEFGGLERLQTSGLPGQPGSSLAGPAAFVQVRTVSLAWAPFNQGSEMSQGSCWPECPDMTRT
jgi:hypothetical protein